MSIGYLFSYYFFIKVRNNYKQKSEYYYKSIGVNKYKYFIERNFGFVLLYTR